jgi:hypothetical protein
MMLDLSLAEVVTVMIKYTCSAIIRNPTTFLREGEHRYVIYIIIPIHAVE